MLVLIEGNLSASKSTVVSGLSESGFGQSFLEPLEKENPWLPLFYDNPQQNGTYMQLYTLFYRYRQWKLAQALNAVDGDKVYLMDRSLFFDHVFAKVNHDLGNITDIQMNLYQMAHSTLQEQIYFPDLCLWLRLSPENCLERLKKRSRSCECDVSLDYLQNIEKAYNKAMETMSKKCPVVEVDASKTKEEVLSECKRIIIERKNIINSVWPVWKGGL